jgi:hypothetical protein
MSPTTAAAIHIGIGSISLLAYWAALLARKGAPVHKSAGRISLATLVIVGLSVAPILFIRPGPFDPGWVIQMVYLTACTVTVSMIGYSAIRYKASPDRFRSPAFRMLGPVLLVLGIVVLVAGVAKRDPVVIVLSWVGLVYGPAMIGFSRYKGPLHPRWWVIWHLNAVAGLFNAVNGNFMFVAWRSFGLGDSIAVQAGFQILTTLIALLLRLWFGTRFDAPMRFSPVTQRVAGTSAIGAAR